MHDLAEAARLFIPALRFKANPTILTNSTRTAPHYTFIIFLSSQLSSKLSKMPLVVPGITPASKSAEQTQPDHKKDGKAQAQDFQAQPGPAIPEDKSAFEKPASREELHARAKDLNK